MFPANRRVRPSPGEVLQCPDSDKQFGVVTAHQGGSGDADPDVAQLGDELVEQAA